MCSIEICVFIVCDGMLVVCFYMRLRMCVCDSGWLRCWNSSSVSLNFFCVRFMVLLLMYVCFRFMLKWNWLNLWMVVLVLIGYVWCSSELMCVCRIGFDMGLIM